jgi:N,N'-diacetyllegionaminate synthase
MSKYSFANEVTVGNTRVGEGSPTYIIAEAGVNHNGSIALAFELVDVAVESGADAVKFQLFNTAALISDNVEKASYQVQDESDVQSQFDMLKQLEISAHDCKELAAYAETKGIDFIVTPFDEPSLEFLKTLSLSSLKISSTDLTNTAFLLNAAETQVPLILSTGMSEQSEVDEAMKALSGKCSDVILLQCTSSYPAPEASLNLRVMEKYAHDYGVIVGYSDHTAGIGASPYAVAAGAQVIEKHFTLDKSLPGPDHQASLSPSELQELVNEVRRVDMMMGRDIKRVELCEKENRNALQKCLVAKRAIEKGESYSYDNVVARRTGGKGIPANYLSDIVGNVSHQHVNAGEIINA